MSDVVTVYSQNNIAVSGVGIQGASGVGVPSGGTVGQVLVKVDGSHYNTQWVPAPRPTVQMLATRCGLNNGAQFSTSQPGCESRIRHYLPYGAKSLYPVYSAFYVTSSGTNTETASPGGFGWYAVTATVVAGGASYAVGDVITVSGVATNQFAPLLQVDAVSSGAVTALSVVDGGGFGAVPATGLTTTKKTGSGNNALTVTLGVRACAFVMQAAIEQVWNTQTAISATNMTGVMRLTAGANVSLGKANIMLPFTETVSCDSLQVGLSVGSAIGTRIYTPGTGFFVGRYLSGSAGLNESGHSAIALASATPTGGTYPSYASPAPGFQPIAIMGIPQVPGPTFAIIGDSLGYGTVSAGGVTSHDTLDANGNGGYIERAINQIAPFTNFAVSSDKLANWLTQTGPTVRLRLLQQLNISHVVDQLGINDAIAATNYTTFKAQKIKFWSMLMGLGIKEIWATTLTPNTTSTDSWATTTNQTPTAANAVVQAYNADLRAGMFAVNGVARVLDLGTTAESTVGSGIWPANSTGDGLHPTQAQTATMAAAIASAFSLATL